MKYYSNIACTRGAPWTLSTLPTLVLVHGVCTLITVIFGSLFS